MKKTVINLLLCSLRRGEIDFISNRFNLYWLLGEVVIY